MIELREAVSDPDLEDWLQQGNEAMRRLNERLGYVYRGESVTLTAPLPLP